MCMCGSSGTEENRYLADECFWLEVDARMSDETDAIYNFLYI